MSCYKIGVFGISGVGKTAIVIQFCANHFVEEYDSSIEDTHRKRCVIDGEACVVDVLDTAGMEEFSALRRQWIRDYRACLLVYSVTSKISFDLLNTFRQEIIEETGGDAPIFLVGNKADLTELREVTVEEEEEFANLLQYKLYNTSAKTRSNVEEIFYDMVREIRVRSTQQITTVRRHK